MEPSLMDYLPLVVIIVIAWAIGRSIKKTANKYPPVAPEQSAVSGVGGWLLLLIIFLMFLGPLLGAGGILSDLHIMEDQYLDIKSAAGWGTLKSIIWGIFLLRCCLSFYAGLGLVRGRNILVVKRAKIILWIIGPVYGVVAWLLFSIWIIGKAELSDPKFIGSMIGSIIAAAIWTIYLSKSKRVKATYGSKNPSG